MSRNSVRGCKIHKFYLDPTKNLDTPAWFIECGREEAEDILRSCVDRGNVMIRLGSQAGNYALSSRIVTSNGTPKITHFAIKSTALGFLLDVDNKPPPMSCLSEVMKYYLENSWFQSNKPINLRSASDPQMNKRIYMNDNFEQYSQPSPLNHDYYNEQKSKSKSEGCEYITSDGHRDILMDRPDYANRAHANNIFRQLSTPVTVTSRNSLEDPPGYIGSNTGYLECETILEKDSGPDYVNVNKGISQQQNSRAGYVSMNKPLQGLTGGSNKDYVNFPSKDSRSQRAKSFASTKAATFDCTSSYSDDSDIPTSIAPRPPVLR